jgi:hypothetical protein
MTGQNESSAAEPAGEVAPPETLQTPAPSATHGEDEPSSWDVLLADDDVVQEGAPSKAEEVVAGEATPQGADAAETSPAPEPGTVVEVKPLEASTAAKPPEARTPEVQPQGRPAREEVRLPSLEEIEAMRRKEREDAEQQLAQVFATALTAEDAEALRIEPEKVLPKLLARAGVAMYQAASHSVMRTVPTIVEQERMARVAADDARQKFYDAWPQLEKPEYRETVERTVVAYRQMYPNVPLEQAVREAGAMAVVALRLPPEASVRESAPGTAATKPRFQPAAPGGGTVSTKPRPVENEFTKLAEELLQDR